MDKPVIGIMACNRMVGVENAHAVMERYVRAAVTYGDCLALLIPPMSDHFSAAAITRRLDGLMLTGSPSNIQPELYGDDANGEGPYDESRDHVSMAMIACMMTKGKPVFGICRGFQEINVVMGGTLRRDVGVGQGNRLDHHAAEGTDFDALFEHYHEVELTQGGVLRSAFNRDHISVNSVHYQGVDRLGAGLNAEAVASDGLIEAFSANISGAQVLGVQWHPEWQTERHPQGQAFFRLMGAALRGKPLNPAAAKTF